MPLEQQHSCLNACRRGHVLLAVCCFHSRLAVDSTPKVDPTSLLRAFWIQYNRMNDFADLPLTELQVPRFSLSLSLCSFFKFHYVNVCQSLPHLLRSSSGTFVTTEAQLPRPSSASSWASKNSLCQQPNLSLVNPEVGP